MRFSRTYIPTLKEVPSDAEVTSHKLLLRAGMIRRLTSGLYSYLPLAVKVLNRISRIIREEMERAGFQELLLPMVQPADLWRETGRWEHYGKELLRFRDRNDRDYCLGPTHEEVVTDLVRHEVRSYKQLPLRVYQLQTKFRDEIRPRFGLMRGREFIMKDAYSFDATPESAQQSYQLMFEAYQRIFGRLGLRFRAVEADTGSIGGNFSHEFMVLADAGEDTIAACDSCGYAANVERAEVRKPAGQKQDTCPPVERVATPGVHSVSAVAAFLGAPQSSLVKTMIFMADGQPVAVLVRGDRTVNDVKLKKFLGATSVELAGSAEVERATGAPIGFAGPVGLDIPVYADQELELATDYITGANAADAHYRHVDLQRDANVTSWADLRQIEAGDACPRCQGHMTLTRGIEGGHVFMLGLKYSESMNATFLDENGKEQPMIMGCYGIGVSRLVAAAIEQNNDQRGIIFPPAIAPVDCLVLNLDPKDQDVCAQADWLSSELEKAGVEVLLDDRQERPGVKFNDADLLGIPLQLVIGARGLARGIVEAKDRRTGERVELDMADFMAQFTAWRDNALRQWQAQAAQ